jgi:hypothetical protein
VTQCEARPLPLAALIRRAFPYTRLQTDLETSTCARDLAINIMTMAREGSKKGKKIKKTKVFLPFFDLLALFASPFTASQAYRKAHCRPGNFALP